MGLGEIYSDRDALNYIAELMDGKEWNSDTLDEIAETVRMTGREINEPESDDHKIIHEFNTGRMYGSNGQEGASACHGAL